MRRHKTHKYFTLFFHNNENIGMKIIYSLLLYIEWPLFLELALKLVLDAKTILPRRAIRYFIVKDVMSENHTDLIVSVKEACRRPVKEEKTLQPRRVAGYFIVKDVMLENQEDLT